MLFQEMEKLKRSSIMSSIVAIALGCVMIMCPEGYIPALVSMLGYAMMIFAIVRILFFISEKKVLINYIIFTGSLLLGILGIAVLVFQDNMVQVIGLTFGLIQVVYGLLSLIYTLTFIRRSGRKGWWIMMLLSLLSIVFGLAVLVNPWWSTTAVLFDVIGIMILFSSAVDIVQLIMIWPLTNSQEGGN